MQYSTLLLTTLSLATTALSAPHSHSTTDNTLRITLSNQATELGSQTVLASGSRKCARPVGSKGPFQTVELTVGAGVAKQDTRCQILDAAGQPIIVTRGANTDITFADGDKGEWTFAAESVVSKIVCDPKFVKAAPGEIVVDAPSKVVDYVAPAVTSVAAIIAPVLDNADTEVRVVLSNQAIELGSQTAFDNGDAGRQESRPVASSGPFQTVEIRVGAGVQKQDLRCQVIDTNGEPIIATRGANTDVTFSDADKGEWTFKAESEVSNIICDPAFKSASA